MSAKPKDHTKTIQSIKKTVGELRKSVNSVSKGHEKMAAEKNTQLSPEDHKAALNHFASQYKVAKMNGQEDKASDYAKSYHEYASKMDKHYHSKLKESADFCLKCEEDPCVCGGNHLDGGKVQEAMKPGWMLKADPELAKKVKAKQDLHKKRVASYGNQSAGKSVSKVKLDELSKSTLKSYVDKVATGPSRGKTQSGLLKSIKAITGVSKAIRKQHEGSNVKEDVQQVNELSKKTLGSYIKKATGNSNHRDIGAHAFDSGYNAAKGNDKAAEKSYDKYEKRKSGIHKATDRLTKEEVEQVNESRRSSAEASVQRHWKEMDSVRDLRDKGVTASDVHAQADKHAKIHSDLSAHIRDKINTDKSYQGSAEHRSLLKKMNSAMSKEQNLRNKADNLKIMHKESTYSFDELTMGKIQQVNELKTSTLSSYLEKKHKKATGLPVQTYDRQKGMIHKDPKTGEQMSADKAGSKVAKHLSNIAKAQDKIRKNVNKNVKPSNNDYSSSIQKDYEKNKGRYQGD